MRASSTLLAAWRSRISSRSCGTEMCGLWDASISSYCQPSSDLGPGGELPEDVRFAGFEAVDVDAGQPVDGAGQVDGLLERPARLGTLSGRQPTPGPTDWRPRAAGSA